MDNLSREKRSRIMASIKAKDTMPETVIRKALHRRGFRYKLHDSGLPGKPDIVLPRYKAIVEINGCFWHGHNCYLFRLPSTRQSFWLAKIIRNKERGSINHKSLESVGWRVLVIWECAIAGKSRVPLDDLVVEISDWILQGKGSEQIPAS